MQKLDITEVWDKFSRTVIIRDPDSSLSVEFMNAVYEKQKFLHGVLELRHYYDYGQELYLYSSNDPDEITDAINFIVNTIWPEGLKEYSSTYVKIEKPNNYKHVEKPKYEYQVSSDYSFSSNTPVWNDKQSKTFKESAHSYSEYDKDGKRINLNVEGKDYGPVPNDYPFDKIKKKSINKEKYVVLIKMNEEWDMYTALSDHKQLIDEAGSCDYSHEIKLPFKIFGRQYVPALIIRDNNYKINTYYINQRDLGVNINQLPK